MFQVCRTSHNSSCNQHRIRIFLNHSGCLMGSGKSQLPSLYAHHHIHFHQHPAFSYACNTLHYLTNKVSCPNTIMYIVIFKYNSKSLSARNRAGKKHNGYNATQQYYHVTSSHTCRKRERISVKFTFCSVIPRLGNVIPSFLLLQSVFLQRDRPLKTFCIAQYSPLFLQG